MLAAFGKKQYGPWSDPRLPGELREPYSSWSSGPDNTYGGRPLRRPSAVIFWGLVFVVVALAPLAIILSAGGAGRTTAVIVVGVVIAVVLLMPALFFLRVGFVRRAWVKRVKRATGMSPFTMERKGIPPPGT